jgi:hypothetical protein
MRKRCRTSSRSFPYLCSERLFDREMSAASSADYGCKSEFTCNVFIRSRHDNRIDIYLSALDALEGGLDFEGRHRSVSYDRRSFSEHSTFCLQDLPDTIHSPPKAILLPRAKISYSNRLQPQRREPLGFSFALIFENLFRTIGNRIGNAWSPRLRLGLGSFGKVP